MDLLQSLSDRGEPEIPDELKNLSSSEVEFLDAVISRAGPTATTFLTIFKAYNDILSEKHIDPDETLLYGKLLKLGTLKGASWHAKWSLVQASQKRSSPDPSWRPSRRTAPFHSPVYAQNANPSPLLLESDTTSNVTAEEYPQYHGTPSLLSLDDVTHVPEGGHHYSVPTPQLPGKESLLFAPHGIPSRPPSYRSTDVASEATFSMKTTPGPHTRSHVPIATRKRGGSVLNEEEAWRKIRASRDEEDAVAFREGKLVERCWNVWREGFLWIQRTNDQITDARNNLLVRTAFQRWSEKFAASNDLSARVVAIFRHRIYRKVLAHWKARLQLKRQSEWRESMRRKIKAVRSSRDYKLKQNAWEGWRRSWQVRMLEQRFETGIVHRYLGRWKIQLAKLHEMSIRADGHLQAKTVDNAVKCWDMWRRLTKLREIEGIVRSRVDQRLLRTSMQLWVRSRDDFQLSNVCSRGFLLRNALQKWKRKRQAVKALERKGDKHIAKQNQLLLLAVARVWKAKERGVLLERVRDRRCLRSSLQKWHGKFRQQQQLEVLANEFSRHSGEQLVLAAFRVWRHAHHSRYNAVVFADQFYEHRVQARALSALRLRYWKFCRQSKKARQVAIILTKQRALQLWIAKFRVARLERRLLEWNRLQLFDLFQKWNSRTRKRRWYHYVESEICKRRNLGLVKSALAHWTNRVIELKTREIDVFQQSNSLLLRATFQKWRNVRARHLEELRLMESYQIIKQNETVRRLFHTWLNGAKRTRYRRVTLAELEKRKRMAILDNAWDKWQEKYQDEKLRPLEISFLMQAQKNLLFHAYGIWYSKTKTIPAIRLYTSNLKAKVWAKWATAIPRALQTKVAKERDRVNVQRLVFRLWLQRYRARLARRAIARARHLRLPTSSSRSGSRGIPRPFSIAPRVAEDQDDLEQPKELPRPSTHAPWSKMKMKRDDSPGRWTGGGRSVKSTSPARTNISAPAWIQPSRGDVAGTVEEGPIRDSGGGRTRLWLELQAVKRGRGIARDGDGGRKRVL